MPDESTNGVGDRGALNLYGCRCGQILTLHPGKVLSCCDRLLTFPFGPSPGGDGGVEAGSPPDDASGDAIPDMTGHYTGE